MEIYTSLKTLQDIVSPPPFEGGEEGTCMICMSSCSRGHFIKKIVSSNFTNYSNLHDGNIVCCRCARLLRDPKYRRSNWIAGPGFFKEFKRAEFLDVIFKAPIPFVVFITKSYKKHGFLHGTWAINYSKEPVKLETIQVIFEERVIRFSLRELDKLVEAITPLVKLLGKRRIMDLDFAAHHLEKILDADLYSQYQYLIQHKNSELLEFAIHVLPKVVK